MTKPKKPAKPKIRTITVANIRAVLPAVAKIPEDRRIKMEMGDAHAHCATGWILIKNRVHVRKLVEVYDGYHPTIKLTSKAREMLSNIMKNWDGMGVWPS